MKNKIGITLAGLALAVTTGCSSGYTYKGQVGNVWIDYSAGSDNPVLEIWENGSMTARIYDRGNDNKIDSLIMGRPGSLSTQNYDCSDKTQEVQKMCQKGQQLWDFYIPQAFSADSKKLDTLLKGLQYEKPEAEPAGAVQK